MRVCKVVVFLDGPPAVTFKGFVAPGARICDMVHDGTIILLDGKQEEVTEIKYETMESGRHKGRLITFLADDYPAKIELGIYCVRKA